VRTNLAFRNQVGSDPMTRTDGQEDSWDKMEDYLKLLVDASGTASGSWGAGQLLGRAPHTSCATDRL
jgi:hypothetical protein